MARINITKISGKQILTIEKGLLDYDFIMKNWKSNSSDFQEVYYEFYLKAEFATFGNLYNRIVYFNRLKAMKPTDTLFDIMADLNKIKKHNEFSVSTKLLHTFNPANPIYDSKIREYLSKDEHVDLWWNLSKTGAPRSTPKIDKIKHDWVVLNDWYNSFLKSTDGKKWIAWFNGQFPKYTSISDVKKIDFIIFACK